MPKSYCVKAELHCHSNQGFHVWNIPFLYDSIQTTEDIIDQCIRKDIRIITITDHDSLAGSRQAQALVARHKLPLLVIPSSEISSRDGHILAYGIHEEIPSHLTAKQTIEEIHRQGGLAVAAHPFMLLSIGNLVHSLPFDAMEKYNSMIPSYFNQKAAAANCTLPGVAGSDAHQPEEVGRSLTLFPSGTDSIPKFLSCIKSGSFGIQTAPTPFLPMAYRHIIYNLHLKLARTTPVPA